MAQQHARLTVVITRELRAEGITVFKLYAPGEYMVTRFYLVVLREQYTLACSILTELHVRNLFYIASAKINENNTQFLQQTENE